MAATAPPRRRPLLVYALAVLVPGLALAALGLRTLQQDRALIDQQIRDRVESAAGAAVAGLSRELARWDAALAQVAAAQPRDAADLPDIVRRATETPAGAVLLISANGSTRVVPDGALLYAIPGLTPAVAEAGTPPRFAAAETLEFRQRDLTGAIAAYRALAASPDPGLRARALTALARSLRKSGQTSEARDAYLRLGSLPSAMAGALPAGLVALDGQCDLAAEAGARDDLARCSLEFARALVEGRWLIERSRYRFYSDRARAWLADAGVPAALATEVDELERLKTQLTDLVARSAGEAEAAAPGSGGHRMLIAERGAALLFWRTGSGRSSHARLVLAPSLVSAHVWPDALGPARADDVELEVIAPDGSVLFTSAGRAAASARVAARSTVRDLQDGHFLWRVRATSRDPSALYEGLRSRQLLYGAMLALMVSSLVAGVVLTWRTLQRELEVAERESAFVSAVSHEFRSPLAGIRQLSDMLVRGRVPSDDRRQQYYLTIRRESDRLARLVENVLDIARIKDGRKEYRAEPIDTVAWLRGVTDEFQQTLDTDHRQVVAAIPDTLPAIRGDRQALSTVVHNLLDNAVKYSPGCPTVWLDADEAGDSVSIHVRDEGVGIPPDEQARVFDRFYRGRELADEVRGTGLGLSLVRHIVEAHGGSIDLASAPGTGSTFTVRLPRDSAGSPVPVTSALVDKEADTT